MKDSKSKTSKKNKGSGGKYIKPILLTLLALTLVIVFAGVLYINQKLVDIPLADSQYLKTYQTSKIVDKNGNSIWEPTDKRVKTIEFDEIPETYKEFIIGVEDSEFWESKGFSPKGIANMVLGTIRSKFDEDFKARGGSTIDQQLIKNKFYDRGFGHEVTTRKIQELFLSRQLNENFTKEEILTFYVNDLEFAEGARGIKAIMRTYFNKSPEDYEEKTIENIAEQAYLAGLSQAPSRYNLYTEPDNAHTRMKTVLGIVKELDLISEKEYNEALKFDLTTNLQERSWEANQQHQRNLKYKIYTEGVRNELKEMGYNLDKLTLTVKSHLDPEVYESIQSTVRDPKYYLDENQQVAVSVIDSNGVVVGMVGSRNENDELNRAMQKTRSSGSATKPFLAYGPLLQNFGNQYTTASTFDTSSYRYPGSQAVMHNYGRATYGQQTMQQSLRMSYNTPIGRIMDGVLGSDRVKQFLAKMDLDEQDTYTSVDGLGIHISTLQSAAAFNTLNNLGTYTPPRFIDTITFSNGVEKEITPTTNQAMNPSVAWVLNHMLKGVPMQGGTAPDADINMYSGYAAKTGTVGFADSVNPPAPYGNGSSDLWFNTITNKGYSISIWTGYDVPNTSPQLPSSYKSYLLLNRDLQLMLNKGNLPVDWSRPEGVRHISGEGIGAHYGVSDSSDEVFRSPNWTDPVSYSLLGFDRVVGDDKVKPSWKKEAEKNPWYDYYKEGGELTPRVIDEELYNRIKGIESSDEVKTEGEGD